MRDTILIKRIQTWVPGSAICQLYDFGEINLFYFSIFLFNHLWLKYLPNRVVIKKNDVYKALYSAWHISYFYFCVSCLQEPCPTIHKSPKRDALVQKSLFTHKESDALRTSFLSSSACGLYFQTLQGAGCCKGFQRLRSSQSNQESRPTLTPGTTVAARGGIQ